MKHLFTKVSSIAMAAAMLLTTGCFREIEERIDVVDQEIQEIDNTLAAMDATIASLSTIYATIQNFDALKDYAEILRSDLDKLQTTFDVFQEYAGQTYATNDQLTKVKSLASAINNDLMDLAEIVSGQGTEITANKEEIEALKAALATLEVASKGFATLENIAEINARLDEILEAMEASGATVAALDLKVTGLAEAIGQAQESLAGLTNLVYFITMEIIPEAIVDGAPAVLFTSDENGATISVTLDVAPAARVKELEGHISFSIVPVAVFTRAAEATVIDGKTYTVSGSRLTVTAPLPEKAPFYDTKNDLWNVEQAFAISAKYIDEDGLAQLATPYIGAYLTSSGSPLVRTVSVILGEKNAFWESVAKGIKEAAELEEGMTVEVKYCSTQKEQVVALNDLYSAKKKVKGLIIYPVNESVEDAVALMKEDIDIPMVVVGKELAKTSPLAGVCKTQVIASDTTAIKQLSQYVTIEEGKKVVIMGLESSETSQARVAAAQKYLPEGSTNAFTTAIDKAADKLSLALELVEDCAAVMLLDDELIIPEVLASAKDFKTYVFGSTAAIKTGVADGSIAAGMFKNGYKFGVKSYSALFNTVPNPCIIEAEAVLPEPPAVEED